MGKRIRKKLAKVDAMINQDLEDDTTEELAELLSAEDYEDTKRHLPRLNTEK